MYIAVQAVLAIVASWDKKIGKDDKKKDVSLTATVIDSGDGVTHVVPVSDGYVIGSSIKHIPLAGKDITSFIQQLLTEREEPIPPPERMQVAQLIKERYSYVSRNMVDEFIKFDTDPKANFKQYKGFDPVSKRPYVVDVGYEQFLAPELFFNPEIFFE